MQLTKSRHENFWQMTQYLACTWRFVHPITDSCSPWVRSPRMPSIHLAYHWFALCLHIRLLSLFSLFITDFLAYGHVTSSWCNRFYIKCFWSLQYWLQNKTFLSLVRHWLLIHTNRLLNCQQDGNDYFSKLNPLIAWFSWAFFVLIRSAFANLEAWRWDQVLRYIFLIDIQVVGSILKPYFLWGTSWCNLLIYRRCTSMAIEDGK